MGEDEPTPTAVLVGEWWDKTRREIAWMTRAQLEAGVSALMSSKRKVPAETEMLWLRYMLAYGGEIKFYQERDLVPPSSAVRAVEALSKGQGKIPRLEEWGIPWCDIFADVRAGEREVERLEEIGRAHV